MENKTTSVTAQKAL